MVAWELRKLLLKHFDAILGIEKKCSPILESGAHLEV
jgi:hypothetical protein